jgi:hypothetical protein
MTAVTVITVGIATAKNIYIFKCKTHVLLPSSPDCMCCHRNIFLMAAQITEDLFATKLHHVVNNPCYRRNHWRSGVIQDVAGSIYIFSEHGHILYYSLLDDWHSYSIHSTECNVDRFRLLHDTHFFPIPIMRLLQPRLWMKVYNICAQSILSNKDDRQWWHIHIIPSCIYLHSFFLSRFPFACRLQCTTHQMSVARWKKTYHDC